MLLLSVILFAVAALGGLVLGVLGLRQRDLPMWLSIIHGAVAAAWAYYFNSWGRSWKCGITTDARLDPIPYSRPWRIRTVFLPFTTETSS